MKCSHATCTPKELLAAVFILSSVCSGGEASVVPLHCRSIWESDTLVNAHVLSWCYIRLRQILIRNFILGKIPFVLKVHGVATEVQILPTYSSQHSGSSTVWTGWIVGFIKLQKLQDAVSSNLTYESCQRRRGRGSYTVVWSDERFVWSTLKP